MVGRLAIGGIPAITMEDDGTYTAADGNYKPLADWLNVAFDPVKMRQAGDSTRPFGVAALSRAAVALKAQIIDLPETPPLPAGAVS